MSLPKATLPRIRPSQAAAEFPPAPTFLALASRPGIVSLAGGIPDPSVFPFSDVRRAATETLADESSAAAALQYAPSHGLPALRDWIAADMRRRGVSVDPEGILVTGGAQQAIDLVAKLLIDDGDEIAVTSPTFFAALDTFRAYRPRFLPVPLGPDGLDLNALEDVLRRRPKLLYLIPDFQNPTGLTLGAQHRLDITTLAERYQVPVIEDAAYDRLRFEGEAIPPFASGADAVESGGVIYLNTFSKVIAPGLRVGWIAAARSIVEKLRALKLAADVHTSVLNQQIVLRVAEHDFGGTVERAVALYRARRDAMLDALAMHMPEGSSWTRPAGGMFLWLQLPPPFDAGERFERVVSEAAMAYVPGRLSCIDGSGRNACRLSFATADAARIAHAIERFGRLVRDDLAASGGASPGGRSAA